MKQFMDIFSLPEMTLLAVANDFFISNNIEYDPIHLYKDVSVSSHKVSHNISPRKITCPLQCTGETLNQSFKHLTTSGNLHRNPEEGNNEQ